MKTVETVLIETLLSAKKLVSDMLFTPNFTGDTIRAHEFITAVIMSHPAKDNIVAALTGTFDFNRKFGVAALHNYRDGAVAEFAEFQPLETYNNQIIIKVIKNKTGWYANEDNAKQALKHDRFKPNDKCSNAFQFFVIGTYESTDTISVSQWHDWCENSEGKLPEWYTNPDSEAIQEAATEELMDFRASQNAH